MARKIVGQIDAPRVIEPEEFKISELYNINIRVRRFRYRIVFHSRLLSKLSPRARSNIGPFFSIVPYSFSILWLSHYKALR
jgi:hypothetical protein